MSQCHHSCSYAESRLPDLEVKNSHLQAEAAQHLHSTQLPVRLWVLGSHQERCTQDWCSQSMVSVTAVRNQMVLPCAEWWCETDNQATTRFGYCLYVSKHGVSTLFGQMTRMPRSYLTAPPRRTQGDHWDTPVLRGWRLSSRTWNPITSSWMKQGDW